MQPAPTIADLHKLGIRHGFPAGQVHQILHDMAFLSMGVRSLTALDDDGRRRLADSIRAHPVAHRGRDEPVRRQASRSGKSKADGVVKMVTPRQMHFIRGLFSELNWSESLAGRWLQHMFTIASIDAITTSHQAGQVINGLLGEKRRAAAQSERKARTTEARRAQR